MTNLHADSIGAIAVRGAAGVRLPVQCLGTAGVCALMLLPTMVVLAQESEAVPEIAVPGTTDYLLLGLAVIALILGIWVARMVVRFRTLRQDEATLEALGEESEAPALAGEPVTAPGAEAGEHR